MHNFKDDKAAPKDDKAAPPYSESDIGLAEQDTRPLPEGWIRQWDSNHQQYFFVDTRANPPRSIWDHPLDDVQYRKAHGLPADSDSESTTSSSSSSDSESGDKKKKKSGAKLKRHESPNRAGPSSAAHPSSPGGGRGLLGMLGQTLFGPRPQAPVSPAMAGPSTAPMQPGMMFAPPSIPFVNRRQMKAARLAEKRSYRQAKREEKHRYRQEKGEDKRAWREEKRARKQEWRTQKAQWKAARRGYGFPGVPGGPGGPQMPGMPRMPGMPQMPRIAGVPPVPQVPSVPGSSREYQAEPGYGMPSEKRA